MSNPEMVTIPLVEYLELQEDVRFLDALRVQGVDNWIGYDLAIESLNG